MVQSTMWKFVIIKIKYLDQMAQLVSGKIDKIAEETDTELTKIKGFSTFSVRLPLLSPVL